VIGAPNRAPLSVLTSSGRWTWSSFSGLAENVRADHRHDQGRLRGNHRLVRGRRLEGARARAIRLVEEAHAGAPAPQLPEEIQGDAGGPLGVGIDGAGDERVPVLAERREETLPRDVGGGDVHGGERDLGGEDVSGRRRERAPASLRHLARQAKHRRGLAAPTDQRDDLVVRHAQRVRQPQRRAPAAARSRISLTPAWIQGKNGVISARTPSFA
jgi:hypothetical protein